MNKTDILLGLLLISSACYFAFSIATINETGNPLKQLDEQVVIPKLNYTQYASLGMIPTQKECNYPLNPDFYDNTNLIMYDGYGNQYIILSNRFNGQTCPIRI